MYVALHNRSLIKVHGVDSVKLLQNLTTNDVNRLRHRETDQDPTAPPAPSAISSAILNNLGRVLFDVIIYGPADAAANEFYVECEQDARDDLVKHFKKYKLRSKVKFAVEDGLEVTAFVGKKAADLALQYSKNTNEIAVTDPRHPGLGTRAMVPTVAAADVGVSLTSPDFMSNLVEGTLTDYVRCRYHVGVPEGLVEITKEEAFPLESNFDVLNGIDFDKGCYIGQELTARAKFVGVTRKRLLPVTIQPALNPETAPLSGTKIYHKGKSVGKFKRGIDSDGMALLRLSVTHIEDDAELTMEGPDGTTYQVHHQRPAWFMDMLKEMDES
ncbi:hypothetical protein SARC_01524 [Sphaeroforma arctica JP610]|uniref:CAF17 C-terminal domain-containing protein n=1 Tax=Sphaeroforma arctica JP610 TaxID=667725 RepID=A0A0L0GBF2_9EUKA|nr:hypothetical protein SARC_01524 [Sphaeroforma arctica JP610]KNC86330.1 hypothetical protein SARC_01524 [Sphaeroforma arctica JP610]|eukprot:XP_014160232.1 hypothetical protein SARC_01524 [Sphaeroforma arctica JP610]